jgi:putative DNA methylase
MRDKAPWYKPKLIEVSIPLEAINDACHDEKAVPRKGHPATLHLWWARRPLAACRAVLFAQLVDDPSAHPERFPDDEAQAVERERLHRIIKRLVPWENIHDEGVLREARDEIWKSCGGRPPPVLDPFAGGGSIPLEAQRLGLEARASDLNPVAVLINKALIEIPPTWAGQPPVSPDAAEGANSWPGATGLAEDVRRYGKWMRDEAEKRIGHLYPKAKLPGGTDVAVIAWLWARTVTCPNPACGGTMPLVRSFWLGMKKGKERYVEPIADGTRVRFEIRGPDGVPREGCVGRTGATCLLCGTPVPLTYIRAEGQAGRMGAQLMAVVAEGPRQRYYLPPDDEHEKAADVSRPDDVPEADLPEQALGFRVQGYGMRTWADLFTNRQLTTLTTFTDLVCEAQNRAVADAAKRGLSDATAKAYAAAITTYLAFAVSKLADWSSSMCSWINTAEKVRHSFTRQAVSMVWDFLEVFPFSNTVGNFSTHIDWVASCLHGVFPGKLAAVTQGDARLIDARDAIVSTDPPYYDNVAYADLSDYFYVWLRRSLADVYPELMGTMLTPKTDELVADPFRHPGKGAAQRFFEDGFRQVFERIIAGTRDDFPLTVFYAFKQAEYRLDVQHSSTGWETLLEGMLQAGWAVTATWPVRTERGSRTRAIEANALASSIVLACRPRPESAGVVDRRSLIIALREELPAALRTLQQGGIAPVDLAQAAIGPGMAVFSRHVRVNEPDGSAMTVRAALSLINQVLDEVLSQQEGDFGADTRWCLEWFKSYGFDQGPFGAAETLSKAKNTAIAGLERAGVLQSRAGKVRLLSISDLPVDYDSGRDERVSEWEVLLHLAKRLREQGAEATARLMATARSVTDLDAVRELAYLLFSIAEKHGWAETALLFNGLGTSWLDLDEESRKSGLGRPVPVQDQLGFDADEG